MIKMGRQMDTLTWSRKVAELAADALLDLGLIGKVDFAQAVAIIAGEINVRLCLNDYPAPNPHTNTSLRNQTEERFGSTIPTPPRY